MDTVLFVNATIGFSENLFLVIVAVYQRTFLLHINILACVKAEI